MGTAIIIPTYNESKNIESLINRINALMPDVRIFVVDDNSPDGTGKIVEKISKQNPRVNLIKREKKEGLGKAYVYAIRIVLSDNNINTIGMMDADFSHDPISISKMFKLLSDYDVVVGSRYVRGGKTEGWEFWRRALSLFANIYCKIILGTNIHDLTSGFYAINAGLLRRCDFSSIDASGYAFQIEFKYLLLKVGAKILEYPITFHNRANGESKISGHIVSEGILAPWRIRFTK